MITVAVVFRYVLSSFTVFASLTQSHLEDPDENVLAQTGNASRRGLDEALDLVDFIFGEVQLTCAHDALRLVRIASPDDRAAHGGMAQRPGNRDFADRAFVAVGYLSHVLDQRQMVRKVWFRKIGMPSAPVILG